MDSGAIIGLAIGVPALVLTWLTLRVQSVKTRLEYVVTTNSAILHGRVAGSVQVSHQGVVVEDPALVIIRMANTGNQPIAAEDYESPLSIAFGGASEVASASWSVTKPHDLRPGLTVDGRNVRISPALLNPGDILELQALTAGRPDNVTINGRITNLGAITRRKTLPYPPGSGPEGQMIRLDKFMWFVWGPLIPLGIGALFLFGNNNYSGLIAGSVGLVLLILYLLHTRYLVQRRRRWAP